jgi:hypothetical protein
MTTAFEGPVKVLYVAGAGHSGSTLLDILLGNHPRLQGVGELADLPRGGWMENQYCTCYRPARDCPFWSGVRRAWAERVGKNDDDDVVVVEGYLELQDSFTRLRRWPRLLLEERRGPSARFRAYAGQTAALFEAVREVGGRSVVVDSSKSPSRAFALAMMPGIDLRLVHLTRDGRGVAASYKKNWRKDFRAGVTRDVRARPVWKTAAVWTLVNLEAEWVRRRLGAGKVAHVRYEDLVRDPGGVLGEIGRLIDADLTGLADAVSAGEVVRVEHNIAGNHLRMSENIRLRPDAGRWRDKLSSGERRLSWALMGWLLRRYGYTR